jgi:hypothetical protein
MLMQNFKSAADLGITEPQLSALIKTLVLLETGKLVHVPADDLRRGPKTFTGHFNMDSWTWTGDCGTVACIGGTAEMVGGVNFQGFTRPKALTELFYPFDSNDDGEHPFSAITPAQAATALRSYLTTGDAKWSEAVA